MTKLFKYFKNSKKYSIKWNNYFSIYEEVLKKYKNKKIKLLEVGIGDGGSLFMWKNYFKKGSKIFGIDLNEEAKDLKKYGFDITIGDQSKKLFWKNFFKKNKKFDILIDDGGHTNLQQITTFMESLNHINDGGIIVIEDTHTSYMNKKGFRNPSKYSFINFSKLIVENMHRRNPNLKKNLSMISNKVYSVEYFDSIIVFNIHSKKCKIAKNLENNKKLRNYFSDFRHRKGKSKTIDNEFLYQKIIEDNFSKRSIFYKFLEKKIINKYKKNIS